MTPEQAVTIETIIRSLDALLTLWQRMPADQDAEQAKQFDRLSILLDKELTAAEEPPPAARQVGYADILCALNDQPFSLVEASYMREVLDERFPRVR